MENVGALVVLAGLLGLLGAYLLSVYVGFRQNALWGLGTLFFPPIGQAFLALKHWQKSQRWMKILAVSLVAMFLGSLVVVWPIPGTILILGGIAYYVVNREKSHALLNNLLGHLSSHALLNNLLGRFTQDINTEGVTLNVGRFNELAKRNSVFLSNWQGTTRTGKIREAFENYELVRGVKQFTARHFLGMLEDLELDQLNWQDERCQLFLEMMRRKYDLEDRTTLALLLYVHDEINYSQYADRFRDYRPSEIESQDLDLIMREMVLNDIYNDIYTESSPNYRYIRRFLTDLGYPTKEQGNLERRYESTKQELKLQHFEQSLADETDRPYVGIEKQIKTEKQLAAINARISEFIDTSPQAYHIVGQDYSRESRLDNFYRRNFSYVLSRAFDGHCCKCGEGMGQLEFDHFWLPKSSGGNFLMRSKTGVYVNNCIPLCRSCNSSKGNKDFREFFEEEELVEVFERSQSINEYINEHMTDFEDPHFPDRAF